MGAAFGVALLIVLLVPHQNESGETPPGRILVLAGLLVTLTTMVALGLVLRHDLRLPARVAVYAVAYNALIVLVKFVLAPYGLYEVAHSITFESFISYNDPFGVGFTAATVVLLYVGVYALIYRVVRRKLTVAGGHGVLADPRRLVLPILALTFVVAGTGGIALLILASGIDYLRFVFASSVSFGIAVALAVAIALATMGFKSVADRANLIGDAAVLTSFFWVGLYFLLLFHFLWVVYMLVLTSIWPFKVVVPK
jgi:hypothetical protein